MEMTMVLQSSCIFVLSTFVLWLFFPRITFGVREIDTLHSTFFFSTWAPRRGRSDLCTQFISQINGVGGERSRFPSTPSSTSGLRTMLFRNGSDRVAIGG